MQLLRLDDDKVLQSLHADTPLAIGSTFKLYVLAALVKRQVAWDKVVKLDAQHKSLPSGEMQTWPDGSPVTVHTLALKMISVSDNTAADTLLRLAGREKVEKRLSELGMKNPQANVPFLSTRELFQLKGDAALRKAYLAADVPGRIAVLKKLADKPLPNASEMQWSEPIAIDRLEWFASAADLCQLMAWFDKQHDSGGTGHPGNQSRSASRRRSLRLRRLQRGLGKRCTEHDLAAALEIRPPLRSIGKLERSGPRRRRGAPQRPDAGRDGFVGNVADKSEGETLA